MVTVVVSLIILCWFIDDALPMSKNNRLSGPPLNSWPRSIARKLDKMIRLNARSSAYACFDADQTSYQWDLADATFAYLEIKRVMTREKLDRKLALIPFLDTPQHNESLFSYYYRLCDEIDVNVCFNWLAQAFSGLSLITVKTNVDEMLQSNTGNTTIKTILSTSTNNSVIQNEYYAHIPNCYRAQQELYNRLMANGIEVYVLTGAHEELVRMVLCDPKYGYNVKPENVIGITTLLKNGTQRTTARKQIQDNIYDQTQNMNLTFTSYLWSPQPIVVGKYAVILNYINQWKMPVLVAGDTPAYDQYMLFHAYNKRRGTIRLWVNRKDAYLTVIQQLQQQYVRDQKEAGEMVTANRNWIYLKSNDLRPRNGFFSF